MFGLFSPKPDARMQQVYVQRATQVTQVCMYLFENRACPPKDGEEEIDLNDEHNRNRLVIEIVGIIENLNLSDADGESISEILIEMARKEINDPDTVSLTQSNAGMLLTVLNMIDMLARHYYQIYPKYKPMLEMINQLAKICPTGMQIVFGDDLPVEVRRVFPHFSSLFEQNRANF